MQTINGVIEFDGEVGKYIHRLTKENERLRFKISELKLENFDLKWKLERKWWKLWLH